METSNIAPRGMVVTPHHLATQSALDILREGGTAMEATVAAAATLAVVYPHMNGIGGDGFWLIVPPHEDPIVIEACGMAGSLATPDFYKGYDNIPFQGPKSANTVAGTVGGWKEALNYVSECGYQRKSVSRLLADAITYAEKGYAMTASQENALKDIRTQGVLSQFAEVFMPDGKIPTVGERFCQNNLAKTLKHLAENGLNSFYRGELAKLIVEDMATLGMPITEADLANYSPVRKVPLRLLHSQGEILNTPPPTQGVVSLAILGILDKLKIDGTNEGELIHMTVEATKQAFTLRDQYITDPKFMTVDPKTLIAERNILKMAQNINRDCAATGKGKGPGDTIWLGVMDNKGFSVSYIQSLYHHFGSGVLLPKTGIVWHNRGVAFTLDDNDLQFLKPGKIPYHTLNPPAARLKDGRVMIYGTRGGDGQPQTQAAIFHRYVVQGIPLQTSVSLPRWLYGRTVGDKNDKLKVEGRFSDDIVNYLKDRGHDVEYLPAYSELVGQAGALVRHPDGMMEGAFDPRSNGSAAGF
ncbi:oxamate amidohydrolase proenzyme-like [Pectinophora gossypiella]|uniref:oxamate amidohydrolase proenzyme-like n=1 Tax=Pectinophora gossypiella TaxID=13191 RepID=UPI00214EC7B6|nr:oxamate amidohydrolase proenzyme-like [Pectinophora gossypiella]XP_049886747.1 oxamate amidohydrolase proenzyme-like [Pectinophora gossypiella]XP_049886882.1 oxamate amidohydrolase proenzyme-like [Pectinophora gossypiella]